MTKQEGRKQAYKAMIELSEALKVLSEEAEKDIAILQISQWIHSTARQRFRSIHSEAIKVKPLPKKQETKPAKKDQIPNRDIIADSSDNQISQEAEKKSRFGRGQKDKVKELHEAGKTVAEISDILGVQEFKVAVEVDKIK